jgi:hypothetical protein
MDKLLSLFSTLKGTGAPKPPQPWTAGRIAATVGKTVAVTGGAAGLVYGYFKLSAQPATAPSAVRKFVPEEVATWLETDTSLREACDRMLLFANFNKPAFIQLVTACAETARFMHALHTGSVPYGATVPRQLSHYTSGIERALTEFQRKVPLHARADYMEVDNDFDEAMGNLRSNVQLECQTVMERQAIERGAGLLKLQY